MLLLLSKILAVPAYPLGLAICCCLAGAVLAWYNRRKAALIVTGVAVLVLWLFSIEPVSHLLLRGLERRYQPLTDRPANASAIVLQGGCLMAMAPPRQYVEVNEAGDRILLAAKLYQERWAPYLILTGGRIEWMSGFPGTEAEGAARFLREYFGITGDSVLLEGEAKNTRDHPLRVAEILTRRGLPKEVIVITSAAHMLRSVKLFEKQGFIVHPAPVDYLTEEVADIKPIKFLPHAVNLLSSTKAMHEYYGIIAYKILGWI